LSTNFIDVLGVKRGAWKRLISCPKCAKTHLRASVIWKFFPGVIPPDPHSRGGEGRGGKEREDGRGKDGIRDIVGEEYGIGKERKGWGLYRGKGREGRKGREGKGGEGRKEGKEGGRWLGPPKKIPGSATGRHFMTIRYGEMNTRAAGISTAGLTVVYNACAI
jgi:hypothetical protein